MAELMWDASALVKRYVQETGSDTVQALLSRAPPHGFITTVWGYAESFSILLRRHNAGVISTPAFNTATAALRNEVLAQGDVIFVAVPDTVVIGSIGLMRQHNLNATDAAILTAFLQYGWSRPRAIRCILVAADKRLIRAARAEGLEALDPEAVPIERLSEDLV